MNAKRASNTRRPTTTRRRRSTTTSSGYRRRRRPGLSSTVGSAIGMLAVTTLLNLSWPARIGLLVLVLVVVGVVAFLLIHLAPGDPAAVMLGSNATQDQVDRLREQLAQTIKDVLLPKMMA